MNKFGLFFALFALVFFSISPTIFASSQKTTKVKGLYLCSADTASFEESDDGFGDVREVIRIIRDLIFLGCLIYGAFNLFKMFFVGIVPWKELHQTFLVFLVTLFVSIVIKVFLGGAETSETTLYKDSRRSGQLFERCHRQDKGARFVPAQNITKVKR